MASSVRLEVDEPTGVRRNRWPVTRGVPFPPGALRGIELLRLLDEEEAEVPLQVRLLSSWPDGFVRWALLHFQADLEPQVRAAYSLEYGPGAEPATASSPLRVESDGTEVTLDTGPLRARVSLGSGFSLLDDVWLEGQPMLSSDQQPGFVLVDGQGCTYTSQWGVVDQVSVEESGPLRAVVRIQGDHRTREARRLFGYEARLYAYAHLPWLEVEYTFVNDQDALYTDLQRIGIDLSPRVGEDARGLCGAYEDLYESPEPFCIFAGERASFGLFAGSRIYDKDGQLVERESAGELSRKIAHGWVDLSDGHGGLAVAVKNLAQLYPKRISAGRGKLQVDLWPAKAGSLHWHQGMARRHRCLLHFHKRTGREAGVNQVCTCYEDSLMLWAPGWYPPSTALGPLFPHLPDRYPHVEMALRDELYLWKDNNQSLGFLDYGDHPQHGQFERKAYMANNENDLAHGLALQYARTGEPACYEALESIAWHTMDVDVVHHTTQDHVELGGARIHGNAHVQYNCEGIANVSVAPSHMWTEGLLEYHFLSGHPRALETACGIGECLLRMLDRGWAMPPYPVAWHGARDSGWVLIALTALHEATGESRWLAGARRVTEALLDAQGDDGGWGLWLGWCRGLSALHLGIAMTGLTRYHQLTGDERAREGLIRAADALLDHCSFPDGGMTYVAARGYRRSYYSGVAFESLGYVWHLTGDRRYLQAGWVGHRHALGSWGLRGISSLTGTALADWWRGNLRYMYWADQAGLLTDLTA